MKAFLYYWSWKMRTSACWYTKTLWIHNLIRKMIQKLGVLIDIQGGKLQISRDTSQAQCRRMGFLWRQNSTRWVTIYLGASKLSCCHQLGNPSWEIGSKLLLRFLDRSYYVPSQKVKMQNFSSSYRTFPSIIFIWWHPVRLRSRLIVWPQADRI